MPFIYIPCVYIHTYIYIYIIYHIISIYIMSINIYKSHILYIIHVSSICFTHFHTISRSSFLDFFLGWPSKAQRRDLLGQAEEHQSKLTARRQQRGGLAGDHGKTMGRP